MTETQATVRVTAQVIEFTAQVIKVQTMTDGAIRVTLDMAETEIDTASKLMEVRTRSGLLEIAAVSVEPYLNKQEIMKNGTAKRNCKQSTWTA